MKILLHLVIITVLLPVSILGQTHNWVRSNPGGGGAFSSIGASASGIILAGSDLSGAYRSVDGGLSWDVIGVSRGLTETHISGLGFHRTDGDVLFIGTENGLFRSDDGGDSVTKVLSSGYIEDIEMCTSNTNIGYVAYHSSYNTANGVIYKTTDGGLTWSQVSTNIPFGLRILKIVVDPTNADIVYFLSGDGRFVCGPAEVYKSTDGGVSWTHLTSSINEVMDIALSPSSPDIVYITTMNAANCDSIYYWYDLDGDIYKSTDGGNTWGNPQSDYSGVIFVSPSDPDDIHLIDPREPYPWNPRSGTFHSTNGGQTFTKTGFVSNWDSFYQGSIFRAYGKGPNGLCKTLGDDLSNPNNYFWTNWQWAFKSVDAGTVFNNIFTDQISPGFWKSRGFDNINNAALSISPANPDIIYLGLFDMGIWRSLDGGDSWQACNDVPHSGDWDGYGGNCATILADPDRDNVVWASLGGSQNGDYPTFLLKNTNTGDENSWVETSGLPNEQLMGLSVDPNSTISNRTLYVTANRDVYKSTDDGDTWTMVYDCNGCRFTAVDPANGNIVYAGGEYGLFKTVNGGISWTNTGLPEMSASPGSDFWDGDYDGVFDVKTDPSTPDRIYVTALGTNKGLYRSNDNGATWTKLLTDDYMRKVAVAPNNPNVLYATSSSAFESGGYDPNSHGIWYSDDGGQTWTIQNQNMAYPFGLSVEVDQRAQPFVWVGSPGTGFQKSPVPGDCSTIVTSTADSGQGSLRAAVDCAIDGDVITIDGSLNNMTIDISSAPLVISKNITIIAAPNISVAISGGFGQNSSVAHTFMISQGSNVVFDGLDVFCGSGTDGAAIYNQGTLTLRNIYISGEGTTNANSLIWNGPTGNLILMQNVTVVDQ